MVALSLSVPFENGHWISLCAKHCAVITACQMRSAGRTLCGWLIPSRSQRAALRLPKSSQQDNTRTAYTGTANDVFTE